MPEEHHPPVIIFEGWYKFSPFPVMAGEDLPPVLGVQEVEVLMNRCIFFPCWWFGTCFTIFWFPYIGNHHAN